MIWGHKTGKNNKPKNITFLINIDVLLYECIVT